jgi:hypothetical protein
VTLPAIEVAPPAIFRDRREIAIDLFAAYELLAAGRAD